MVLRLAVGIGALVIGAKIYLSVLPHSPALGAFAVMATGGVVAMTFLDVHHQLDESVTPEESERLP